MVLSFKNRMQDKSNVSESQRCPGGSNVFCLLWSGTSSVERMGVNTCVAWLLFCGWSWPRCVGRPNFNTCFIVAAVVLGITGMYMLVHSHKFVMLSGDSAGDMVLPKKNRIKSCANMYIRGRART